MNRRFFNFFTALSLLLFAGTCVLWVRSYSIIDEWTYGTHTDSWSVTATQGRFSFCWVTADSGQRSLEPTEFGHATASAASAYMDSEPSWRRLLPQAGAEVDFDHRSRYLMMPAWITTLVCGILPVIGGARRFRRYRKLGLCQRCGYDLRATPDRCPECGAVPKQATA